MSKFWSNPTDSDASSSSCTDDNDDDNSVDWDESDEEQEGINKNPVELADDDFEGFDPIAITADPFGKKGKSSTTKAGQQKQQQQQHHHHHQDESFSAKAALATTDDAKNDPNLIWEKIKDAQRFEPVPTKEDGSGGSATSSSKESSGSTTRIVLMSDTHGRHRDIPYLPRGDMLIHGGDFTKSGEIGTVQDLSRYFGEHVLNNNKFDNNKKNNIICIAGNHELTFQPEFYHTAKRRHKPNPFDPRETRASLKNCTYLQDETITIEIGNDDNNNNTIEVYGSPWTPAFYDWAFNLPRGEALDEVWGKIPSTTDILITHGPPLGRQDFTNHSGRAGCYELLKHVQDRIRPRLHVFGHLHSSYGSSFDGHTLFVNASNLDSNTELASKACIVVDLPNDKSQPAQIVQPSCSVKTLGDFLTWLEQRSYPKILECVGTTNNNHDDLSRKVPFPEAFYNESAFYDLCGILNLFRDKGARDELRRAVCQLYAESFS